MNQTETVVNNKVVKNQVNSPWRIAYKKFKKNHFAVIGVWVLLVVILISIIAPFLTDQDPTYADLLNTNGKPDKVHLLGTDSSGRDNYSRLLYGGRVSLIIGFSAMVSTVFIGTILGAISGYYGGKIDNLIMRLTDIWLNFPFLLLVLVVVSIVQDITIFVFVSVIALVSWPSVTRIIRGVFLSLREQEYILGARSIGCSDFRIIGRHLLPNAMGPIIVNATLFMANMIIAESALSFLGFGVPQPTPTWGNMLSDALSLKVLQYEPWTWIPPGLMILITVLAINFIGDGLRDALDPKTRKD